MRTILFLISLFIFSINVFAQETCSRVAIVNYQEVLVDANSSEKGEGLRYHLEKDPQALEYLNLYQKNSGIRWQTALLGTAGTGLILYGFFNSDSEDRRTYLITGAATMLVNLLIAKTLEVRNEENLNKAIEEYNKRNLPKIFFNPEQTQGSTNFSNYNLGLAKTWSF